MDTLFSKLPKTAKEAREIGSKYYFTGKPCQNGHIFKRFASNAKCCECEKAYKKDYRDANKEAIKAYIKARQKVWRENNKDKQKARVKACRAAKRAERLGCSIEELPKRSTPDPARYVYFLVVKDGATQEKLFLKVGITNNPTHRLKYHKRQLAKHGLIFDTILIKDFETEEAARATELKIKNSFMVYESGIRGFKDECFMYLPQFEASMQKLLTSANW